MITHEMILESQIMEVMRAIDSAKAMNKQECLYYGCIGESCEKILEDTGYEIVYLTRKVDFNGGMESKIKWH